MKSQLMVLALSAITVQSAFAGETLVSCDGGKFIIEKQCYVGPSQYGSPACYTSKTQLVIRNADIQNRFAEKRAFGSYQHPGQFNGFAGGSDMVISIDNQKDWGMSGTYFYQLSIPYQQDTATINYYVNYLSTSSLSVKAYNEKESVYGIVKKGELAQVQYNDCWIK